MIPEPSNQCSSPKMTQNYRTTGPCTATCNINILNAAFALVKVTAQIKGLILQGWRYTRPRLSSCPPFVFFCIYLQRTLRSNRRLVVMDHFVNFSASILLFISWPKVECAYFSDLQSDRSMVRAFAEDTARLLSCLQN